MENILLLGLGAIGSLVASKFADSNTPIDILLDEKRHEIYANEPFYINKKEYKFSYVTPQTYNKKCDLVIIATKYNALPDALVLLEKIVDENCVIMSLLNGIDSEEIIENKFGKGRCVYAFITKTDATRVGKSVDFVADGKIYFGEKDGTISKRAESIAELFEKAGMDYALSKNILLRQWKKFMVNIGMNQVSAVLGATYGDFLKSEEIIKLTHDAMAEAVSVARAKGLNLNKEDIKASIAFLESLSPWGKTSMLQDVEAKRKTEVDMLAKTLIALGKEYDIKTPINEVLYLQIKAIERMY